MPLLRRAAIVAGTAALLGAAGSALGAQALAAPSAPVAGAAVVAVATGSATDGPLAVRTLPRGTVLQAADVRGDATGVVGFETQRVVTAGEPLRAPAIAPVAVVRAGEAVTVRVAYEGVVVTRSGIALGNARTGQPVRVRLGQHSLSGTAVASGVVQLP